MANWSEILAEVSASEGDLDRVRRKYLATLHGVTKRNVIAFYSGWLQKPGIRTPDFEINDAKMTGFMTVINKLDRKLGLDLILHTPGGEINATEALVNYLRYAFNGDIRAIVPHQAMSAGTMISLACKSIVMGAHSSLGPIDPQVGGAPAHGILEEFRKAQEAFKQNPHEAKAWLPILEKYTPTLVGKCERAVEMAEKIVGSWLETGMLNGQADAVKLKEKILEEFGSHKLSLDHGRHFNYDKVKAIGVTVERLEDDAPLQDAVLSVHHAFTVTLMQSMATSIIENHIGSAFVNQMAIPPQLQLPPGIVQIPNSPVPGPRSGLPIPPPTNEPTEPASQPAGS